MDVHTGRMSGLPRWQSISARAAGVTVLLTQLAFPAGCICVLQSEALIYNLKR